MVISSEALQDVKPELLARFFPIERCVVVMYLREQLDFLWSIYSQRVHASTFADSFDQTSKAVRPNYKAIVDRWATLFPPDRLKVRIYDRSCFAGQDLIADFLSVIGLERSPAFAHPALRYASIGLALVEFKRRLNLALGDSGLDAGAAALLFGSLRALATNDPDMRAKPRLDARFSAAYRSHFVKSNAALFATYFDAPLTAFPMKDFTNNSPREIPDAEIVARIEEVSPQLGSLLRSWLGETPR